MTEITDIDFNPPKVDPRDVRIADLERQLRDSERREDYHAKCYAQKVLQRSYLPDPSLGLGLPRAIL